jgi:hypothetical protein
VERTIIENPLARTLKGRISKEYAIRIGVYAMSKKKKNIKMRGIVALAAATLAIFL